MQTHATMYRAASCNVIVHAHPFHGSHVIIEYSMGEKHFHITLIHRYLRRYEATQVASYLSIVRMHLKGSYMY